MSRIPARILGAVATAALVIAPVATASSAGAATRVPHRHTAAMDFAGMVGEITRMFAEMDGLDGRSTRALRDATEGLEDLNDFIGDDFVRVTGLADRNHDGLDDDAKISVRVMSNIATLTLRKNRTFSVTDGGFVFKNRRSVLKESAQAFDRVLRFVAATGVDSWDMRLLKEVKAEMPTGVRVVSDYDGNHDGYDDDGRLTFLANGKAVTLTIGNTAKQVGKVTYGPTWRTKAPKRTHHPVASPYRGLASLTK
jgi:hypothetical protein